MIGRASLLPLSRLVFGLSDAGICLHAHTHHQIRSPKNQMANQYTRYPVPCPYIVVDRENLDETPMIKGEIALLDQRVVSKLFLR